MAVAKRIAYVLRQAPYGSDFAHDAIDAVLAGGLYGQTISVFFMGDGVFQLINTAHQSVATDHKPLSKKLNALSLYDIEHIFVCQQSLNERNISTHQISIDATILNNNDMNTALRNHDVLLSF